jgi:hypothetical protein|tara:strand:- start:387 stop:536 length:150 start_codon:yes stop_codon:yes gene_type:complete
MGGAKYSLFVKVRGEKEASNAPNIRSQLHTPFSKGISGSQTHGVVPTFF